MIKAKLQTFWKDTSGASSVDYVMLGGFGIFIAVATWSVWDTGTEGVRDNNTSYFDNINDNANF